MLEMENAYLLYMEFGDANLGVEAPLKNTVHTPSHTLHPAMLPLFTLPLDQFHPDAAIFNRQAVFVNKASIINLKTGHPAMTVQYVPDPKRTFNGVEVSFDIGITQSELRHVIDWGRVVHKDRFPYVFELLAWDSGHEHLVPTELYRRLLDIAMARSVADNNKLLPHPYHVAIDGYLLGKRSGEGLAAPAPSFHTTHFYPDLQQAVVKLLLSPGSHFLVPNDPGAPHPDMRYESVAIYRQDHPEVPIMELRTQVQPPFYPGNATSGPGRFLEFQRSTRETLASLGIDVRDHGTLHGRQIVQLDNYVPSGPMLELTDTMYPAITQLEKQYGPKGPQLQYDAVTTFQSQMPVEQLSPDDLFVHHRHIHTDSIIEAMYHVVNTPFRSFEHDGNSGHHIVTGRIEDRTGNILLQMGGQAPDAVGLQPGIFLALHEKLLRLAPVKALFPAQLFRGDGDLKTHQGYQFFQVAPPGDRLPATSSGFFTFLTNLQATYITQQLQDRPGILKFSARPITEDEHFILLYKWQLQSPDRATPRQFTLAYGQQNIVPVIDTLFHLPTAHFTGDHLQAHAPVRLISAQICVEEHGKLRPLMQRIYDPANPLKTQFQIMTRDEQVLAACHMVVGDDVIRAAMAAGATVKPRMISPDPLPGQHKTNGLH